MTILIQQLQSEVDHWSSTVQQMKEGHANQELLIQDLEKKLKEAQNKSYDYRDLEKQFGSKVGGLQRALELAIKDAAAVA